MKTMIFRLSLCLTIIAIGNLSVQKVNANSLKESYGINMVGRDLTNDLADWSNKPADNTSNKIVLIDETESEGFGDNSTPTSSIIDFSFENKEVNDLNSERAGNRTVTSESALKNALSDGVSNITIGKNFTVSSQLSYRNNFSINGDGHTLTFSNTAGFFSGAASGGTISFNNLTVESSVSYITVGATALVSGEGEVTLNLTDFNYTATKGCPLVSTENVSESVTINCSGTNNLKTSGSGNTDTTLLKNIKDIYVTSGKTTVIDDTPNKEGDYFGTDCYSVVKFWSGTKHLVNIADGAIFDINSSKNILFDLNGSLDMQVGNNAEFNYNNRNNGSSNQIVGQTASASMGKSLLISVGQGSKTMFQTDGPAANFNNSNVEVTATSPDYVNFKSTGNTAAINNKTKINFSNKADNTGTEGNYVLGETPVSSSVETRYNIAVGANRSMTTSKNFQNVIYYKYQEPEEKIVLQGVSTVGANVSTISSNLTGSYTKYTSVEMLASPKELADTAINDAITSAKNDLTGKSGYYQSGSVPSDGKLNEVTEVWAGTYYLYAKLTNTSTGKVTDWIKTTVVVVPYLAVTGDNDISFVGGYNLTLLKSATLTSMGNTDTALIYSKLVENSGSSQNVSLVDKTKVNQKELQLSLQGKNANSTALWSPLLLNTTSFNEKVILSPYWIEKSKSQVTFKVDGNYSGPLGKNQIEKVSYKVTMNLSENK